MNKKGYNKLSNPKHYNSILKDVSDEHYETLYLLNNAGFDIIEENIVGYNLKLQKISGNINAKKEKSLKLEYKYFCSLSEENTDLVTALDYSYNTIYDDRIIRQENLHPEDHKDIGVAHGDSHFHNYPLHKKNKKIKPRRIKEPFIKMSDFINNVINDKYPRPSKKKK
ncbi:MAG TPA: hypothetical protein PKY81_10825 [bacterium]|nr:hypothetical protein [bacterium]